MVGRDVNEQERKKGRRKERFKRHLHVEKNTKSEYDISLSTYKTKREICNTTYNILDNT